MAEAEHNVPARQRAGNAHGAALHALPGFLNLSGKGLAVGGLVGAVGAGGLSVPIFARHMPVTWAIGTASVLSIPLSAIAAITYAFAAAPSGCAGGCLGYIDLPAVCATGVAAVLFAPAGSALAHSLPVPVLKRVFAVGLAVAALNLARKNLPPAESFSREAKAALAGLSPGLSLCRDRGPLKPVRLRGGE